jgi:hypothetical protein
MELKELKAFASLFSLGVEERQLVFVHPPLCILMQHNVLPQKSRQVQLSYSLPSLPSSKLRSSFYAIVP